MKSLVVNLTFIFLILSFSLIYSQLLKNNDSNLISESEIYIDETNNERYSDLIKLKFNDNILRLPEGEIKVELIHISNKEAQNYLIKLEKKYGKYEMSKLVPEANWGDTLVINRRSGELIKIPDWSQLVKINFENLVPIDSIITDLNKQSYVEYAEEPIQGYTMIEPNDELYINNNWAFDKIMAKEAWGITKGDSSITIGIHDLFGNSTSHEIHDDLKGKVKSHYNKFGNHGTCVAGVAGAKTDNEIGVASLGWNLKLRFYRQSYCTSEIMRAIHDNVDILNFSWVITVDIPSFRDAIKTALANGVVCVAASGNNQKGRPDTLYPAAYNFGDLGQVIAVSATQLINGEEKFIDGWNYSPGNDPIEDPISSFIDISAPGYDITMLNPKGSMGYMTGCGTSLATPFVSALAGLLLSIDNTLTPKDIYSIITQTADKIGQYPYDANKWNQYLGYGRINAYKALSLIQPVDVNDKFKSKIISNYILEQNYPNPFNPTTTIKYSLPKTSKVNLSVYDVLGNRISELVSKIQNVGNYEVEFNIANEKKLASGIYLFIMRADNFVEVKKGIVLK